ncbi:thiamine-monophosphate kinase [Candidatus Omnitrophota bacterium]
MRVDKLGEFALIERFRKPLKVDKTVLQGSGDDCAVLKSGKNTYQLLTCDALVDGVDFSLRDDPFLVGRKAVAVSVSDIAACAGIPRYALVTLGLPRSTEVSFIDRLYKGMQKALKRYSINLIGGDLTRSKQLMISVTIVGSVRKKRLVLRRGAKPGDIIFVTGSLGGSIRGKHLRFTPRIKEAQKLTGNFKLNSMIDISDGLVQDLENILKESARGAVIYEELIPKAKEAHNFKEALFMGEDFELLFTLSRREAKKLMKNKGYNCTPIGEIADQEYGFRLIDRRGRESIVRPQGFRHF